MATRIPVSWLLLLIVLAVFAFFGYHIIQASSHSDDSTVNSTPYVPSFAPNNTMPSTNSMPSMENNPSLQYNTAPSPAQISNYLQNVPSPVANEYTAEHVVPRQPPVPNQMPHVSGQTEEDLRAPEPLQATPPSVQYDIPEATDPLNKIAYMSSEFGSNLRHPEQMMERHPGIGMGNVVAAQIGSEQSGPGGNNAAGYAPEMAQNGGEFMAGISAFDTSESGVAYSML